MADERPTAVVTGSSGLLGSEVCLALSTSGYEVFGFDRPGAPHPPDNDLHIHAVDCDLTHREHISRAVRQVRDQCGDRIASVVHLAAYYDFSGEDSPLYEKVTVNGTRNLLVELAHLPLEQFVFSSSMLVHAPCEVGGLISEDSPLLAKWPYPQSKIETERVILEEFPEIRSVLLRIAGVYTEWGTQPTLVQQIKRIFEKQFESHFFPGDMHSGQSSVHLSDTVDSIVRTVDRRAKLTPGTAILIGESQPPSYEELQDAIGQLIYGDNWSTLYIPPILARVGAAITDAMAGGESFIKPFMVNMADDHYALNITRAHQLLDWEPQFHLMTMLPTIVRKLVDEPEEWYRKNDLDVNEIPARAK